MTDYDLLNAQYRFFGGGNTEASWERVNTWLDEGNSVDNLVHDAPIAVLVEESTSMAVTGHVWTELFADYGAAAARPTDVVIDNVVEGDIVELEMDLYLADSTDETVSSRFTFGSVVQGAIVNYIHQEAPTDAAGSLGNFPQWYIDGAGENHVSGAASYRVRAGDIENGSVRFRALYRNYIATRSVGGNALQSQWLKGRGPFKPRRTIQLLFEGQSLNCVPGTNPYPIQLGAMIEDRHMVTVTAWSGQSIPTRDYDDGNAASRIGSDAKSRTMFDNADRNVVLLFGGYADVNSADTAADILLNQENFADDLRTAGADEIVILTLPHSTFYDAGEETKRATYNASLLANANGKFDAVCDVAARSEMQDASDTAWWSGDGVHMNEAGAGVIAEEVYTTLSKLSVPIR